MTKKLFLAAFILIIITGGLFSQEWAEPEPAKNTFTLGVGLLSAELSYERTLSSHFSVLVDASYNYFFSHGYTAAVRGRWYPWGKVFFLDLGLGYGNSLGINGFSVGLAGGLVVWLFTFTNVNLFEMVDVFGALRSSGPLISPGLGWKIDIGKPNGFSLTINTGVDVIINLARPVLFEFLPYDYMSYTRVGFGYSF
ncbi:hypothetical protein FACS189450_04670 [Spirochaetia bacterium]|nr:hypothetical protein FACS189450_04670 [Spirochaetia bacterium]